jgi:hypothetical protein
MSLLKLHLRRLSNVLGIYGASKNEFPARMSLLQHDAAAAFEAVQSLTGQRLRVSDMFRSPESSLQAMQEKRGVQPPGFSAHNFGLAIDIDVDAMLAALKCTKTVLDVTMASKGWYCHRRDHARGMEDWHYNFLGDNAVRYLAGASPTSTSAAIEMRLVDQFRDDLVLLPEEVQEALTKLRFYAGAIDGSLGPRSKQAVAAFQRAWKLPETSLVDRRTERTLALVSCSFDITESQVAASV